jgi:hypothetical protein
VRVRAALWKSSSAIGDCEREFRPVNTLKSFLYNSIPTVHIPTNTAVDMDTAREWLTWSFSPTIGAMLFTLVLALSLPIIFHLILYRQSAAVAVPSFVLLGPSGAGKTTLLTLVRPNDSQAHDGTLTMRAVRARHTDSYPHFASSADRHLHIACWRHGRISTIPCLG